MGPFKLLGSILVAALLFGGCASTRKVAQEPKYRVIAYVMGRADFNKIGAQKLTHINYAFGLVNTNGEAFIRTNAPAHLAQLQALKSKNPKLKVILSVGGWGADNFSDAALTDESRKKFAASCLKLLKAYALDGIDLDWEYPGQRGPGIKFRPEDKENFTEMLREVKSQLNALSDERKRLGSDLYTLTIATAGGNYFKHTEMEKVQQHVDWINIMSYDYYGSGSGPGHHATLFAPANGNYRRTTEIDVKDHLAAGIPANKLVVGAAFYAKSWTNVTMTAGPTGGKYARGYSYPQLDDLFEKGFTHLSDDKAKADYLWNPESKTFISFEGPQALKAKCDFVKAKGLGGVMYWEYSNDPAEILLDVLARELKP